MKYRPTGGRRLEPGEYVAQLTSAHEGTSIKGDQTLELTLTVDGVDIRDRLYNTEAAAWRMKQMRNAFGFADNAAEVEFSPEAMVGKLARVRLEFGSERTSGKYVGKKFLEVAEYLTRGSALVREIEDPEVIVVENVEVVRLELKEEADEIPF